MTHTASTLRAGLAAACAAFALALPAAAFQDIQVAGQVIGPGGTPMPDLTVVLHRVTPEGGTLLADARTDAEGRFVLRAPGPAPEGAVYFVASRFDEQLYIGPMLRAPLPPDTEITLEVGTPENALGGVGPTMRSGPAVGVPGGATGTPRRWLLLIAPVAGLLGVVAWVASAAGGPSAERRTLIDLARLDNRFADAGADADRAAYERRRRQLLDRLDAAR